MGHGKSTIFAVAFPLWWIGKHPNLRIQMVCNTDLNAQKRIMSIRHYIEHSEMYKLVFPEISPDFKYSWSNHMLYVKRDFVLVDPSISSYGIDSASTGSRSDLLILDDPIDYDNTIRQPGRKEPIIEAFWGKWFSRVTRPLHDRGKIAGIGTKYADDDLLTSIEKSNTFQMLFQGVTDDFKAIKSMTPKERVDGKMQYDEEYLPLWSRFPSTEFVTCKQNMSQEIFARSFQNLIIDGKNRRKLTKWELCKNHVYANELIKDCTLFYCGYDPSSTRRAGNAFIVIGVNSEGKRMPVYASLRQTSDEIVDEFIAIEKQFHPILYSIEDVGVQDQFIGMLRRLEKETRNHHDFQFAHKLTPISTTHSVKFDIFSGIPSLNAQFENQVWLLPFKEIDGHSSACGCAWCEFFEDLRQYPISTRTYDLLCAMFFATIKTYTTNVQFKANQEEPRMFGNLRRSVNF